MGLLKKKAPAVAEVTKHYDLGQPLGVGGTATVYLGQSRTADRGLAPGTCVAIKAMSKKHIPADEIAREVAVMRKIAGHPCILTLFDAFLQDAKEAHVVMEVLAGGTLFDRILNAGYYSEQHAAIAMRQTCSALDCLHSRGFVHRDLKPENLMYASDAEDAPLKLIDFGTCVTIGGNEPKSSCGTPGYVAPEILRNEGHDDPTVDMWSAGVVVYILLCGFPPFYQEEQAELFDAIRRAQYDFPADAAWAEVSADAKAFVQQLLTLKGRLSAPQVLAHAWIVGAERGDYRVARGTTAHREIACRKLRKVGFGIIAVWGRCSRPHAPARPSHARSCIRAPASTSHAATDSFRPRRRACAWPGLPRIARTTRTTGTPASGRTAAWLPRPDSSPSLRRSTSRCLADASS